MVFGDSPSYKWQLQIVLYSHRHKKKKRKYIFLLAKNHSDSHEICQMTLLRDFPKGYNHQLLWRDALQEVNLLVFFCFFSQQICIITPAAASDLYVKSLGNCLEVCTDKWTGYLQARETISFSYSSPWLVCANNRREKTGLPSELRAWCNKSPYARISMLCITACGAPPGQLYANQNTCTSFILNNNPAGVSGRWGESSLPL